MEGAPGADALVAYVREQVEVTTCAWIDEAMKPEWKAVKIDMVKV
jgi:ribonuclease P/MRP protein subunit POP3